MFINANRDGTVNIPLDLINELPEDVLIHLFSFLDLTELQADAKVSRPWNTTVFKVINNIESNKIIDFCNSIESQLDPEIHAEQISILKAIGSDREIFKNVNLIQVRSSILKAKRAIIDVLKTLTEEDLEKLSKHYKYQSIPNEFHNIFPLALIYLKLVELEEKKMRSLLLQHIRSQITIIATIETDLGRQISELARFGDFDKINELSANLTTKNDSLNGTIAAFMAMHGDVDSGIKLAVSIETIRNRDEALQGIIDILIVYDNFDKADELASLLSEKCRTVCMGKINENKSQPKIELKKEYLSHLLECGLFKLATNLAFATPDNKIKSELLAEIYYAWLQKGNRFMAETVAALLPNDDARNNCFLTWIAKMKSPEPPAEEKLSAIELLISYKGLKELEPADDIAMSIPDTTDSNRKIKSSILERLADERKKLSETESSS